MINSQSDEIGLPKLWLVCITVSDKVRYKTITRKRLLTLEPAEQKRVLQALYIENLGRLSGAIDFCQANSIQLYRLSSNTFPFADDVIGKDVLTELAEGLRQIGHRANALGIRLVLHPDQFIVLNSDRPDVIKNSIKVLATHARVFDLMGLPRSSWALMNIHGGKGDRPERLISVIRDLPDPIRLRLTLENDEYTYSAAELLEVCHDAEVPMVFDAHHHVVHEKLESYEDPSVAEMLAAARTTWTIPEWQLVHISNGQDFFQDRKHSGLIFDMPSAYKNAPWIEIEAKLKEEAIARVKEKWLPTLLQAQVLPQECQAALI